jgi:hypothetical protein
MELLLELLIQLPVTITDEQSVPTVTLTEQLLSLRTLQELLLTATLSTATTEATLVSLEYTGTTGTDYVASSMTISIPAGDLTRTVTMTLQLTLFTKETKPLLQLHL